MTESSGSLVPAAASSGEPAGSAESRLKEAQARLAATIEVLPDLLFVLDNEGRILDYRAPEKQLLHVPPERFLGRCMDEVLPAEAARVIRAALDETAATGRHRGGRYSLATPAGESWFEISAVAQGDLRTPAGRVIFLARDVTAHRCAEEALRESEARARAVNDNLPGGFVYQVDTGADGQQRRVTFVSRGVERLHGITPEEMMQDNAAAFYRQVHEEDRERMAEREAQAVATMTPFREEVRFRLPTGEIRWGLVTSAPRRLANGHLLWDGVEVDITEHKRAEEALRESEVRFEQLARQSRMVVWEMDPSGLCTFVNPVVEEMFGYRPDEIVGRLRFYDLFAPERREEFKRATFEAFRHQGFLEDFENLCLTKDGRPVWVSTTAFPAFNPDGTLRGYRGSVRDVNERKRAEEALRASETKYRLLFESIRDAFVSVDMAGRIQEHNRAYEELTGYSAEELRHLTYVDLTPEKWRALEAKIVAEQVLPRGFSEVYEKEYRRKDGTRVPIELRTILVRDAAGHPAGMWATIRDISERKRADRFLRLVLDLIPGGVFWKDRNSVFLGCNQTIAQAAGLDSPDQLVGKTDYDLGWKKEESDFYVAVDRRVMENDQAEYHIVEPQLQAGGKEVWLDTCKIPLHDDEGRVIGMLGTFTDITERKRTEEALRESEAKYRRLYAGMRDAFVLANMEGELVDCNPAFEALVGYRRDEIARLRYADITPAKWRSVDARAVAQVLQHGSSGLTEKEYIRKDGTIVPVEMSGTLVRDATGKPVGIFAIVRDITERKRHEFALKQAHDELERRVQARTAELEASRAALVKSEALFRQMAESIQEVFWLFEVQTQQALYISPSFERVWGRSRADVSRSLSIWVSNIQPEDRQRVLEAFLRVMETGEFEPIQYRIVHPDGTLRWLEDRAWAIRDEAGQVYRVAGVSRDITEHRRLESEVLKAGEAERQRIGRDLHDGLSQALTAIGYWAEAVHNSLAKASRPEAADVHKLVEWVAKTGRQARAMAQGLLLTDLKRGGLLPALQELALTTQEFFGVVCRYRGPAAVVLPSVEVAQQLYRIAQEAATNAAKHSHGKRIDLRLSKTRAGLVLSIRDDGQGLPPLAGARAGLGLDIMHYRAGLIGATLSIQSAPGRGTRVTCLIPRPAAPSRKKTS